MRLLPRSDELGWTPFVWLLYIIPFASVPAFTGGGARAWGVTMAGLAVFLVLYFRGFWARGAELVVIVALITVLAVVFVPFNPAATAMFIFAAAFAGWFRRPRHGVVVIAAVVAVVIAEAIVMELALWVWLPALVFSIAIGSVNIHTAERSRANARLRMANEQIEHFAKMAERERISRDLHDLLGHTLSVIVLKAELARRLGGKDPVRASEEIAAVEQIARDALSEVRTAVRGYRRSGITSEIQRAVVVLENAGISVEQNIDEVTLDAESETMLELGVREAVTNVLRHSGAEKVWIELRAHDDGTTLTIRNDGSSGDGGEGMGLRGMKDRASAVGASVQIDRSDGYCIRIDAPTRGGG